MLYILILSIFGAVRSWPQQELSKMSVDYLNLFSSEVESFIGNQTHSDHFKLLKQDGDSLLIGARNIVYNISLPHLQENVENRITWNSRERDTQLCLVKGKNENDCNNYIRVLAKTDEDELLVCGTNSYNPRCRYYRQGDRGVYEVEKEFSGKGYCPYDPKHNSTSIFTDGSLYSGTVSDFSGSDALIIKDKIRTEQYNLKHLNGPDFVGSAEDEDFVYFFFREEAVEFMNCGKSIYSRVGRVCKKDTGGPRTFKNKWTTFLKTRLNCSVPGQYPFYFNEIQSMTQVGDRIFAVFNTPDNSISGSAVCSYKMTDIFHAFEGDFKVQQSANANWLPYSRREGEHRPGACHADSADLSDDHLNFIRENVLMDSAVPASVHLPHFVKSSPYEKLTSIAVDPDVQTSDGKLVDVLFVGTTRGRILRMASFDNGGIPQTNLIEDLQLFPYHVAVNNILIVPGVNGSAGSLVALSDHEVKSVPVHRCGAASVQSCADCVALQDPYCAWNLAEEACVFHSSSVTVDTSALVQQINTGVHQGCPKSRFGGLRLKNSVYSSVNLFEEQPFQHIPAERPYTGVNPDVYSGPTFAAGCIFSALAALVVGFGSGFLVSRKYAEKHSYLKCGHAYLEAQALDRTKKETSHYTEPNFSPSTTTKNNLLSNIPEKNETQKNNLSLASTTSTTVGKSKKIYI